MPDACLAARTASSVRCLGFSGAATAPAGTSTPMTGSPCSRTSSMSLSEAMSPARVRRSSFATTTPSVAPSRMRCIIASSPGLTSLPPDSSISSWHVAISTPREVAHPVIAARCWSGD